MTITLDMIATKAQSQAIVDPFDGSYGGVGHGLDIIAPPFNLYTLLRLVFDNADLAQCVRAMAVNVHGHGWSLEYVGPDGEMATVAAKAERQAIQKLLKYPNEDSTLDELRGKLGFDLEATGNAYLEVGRDRLGRANSLHHIPAQTMRRTTRDATATTVEVHLPREGSDTAIERKRFGRYVQVVNERRIYFREFGDPRKIDPATGQEAPRLAFEDCATEVIAFSLYMPGSPYGAPRWINQLPSILGSRQAELTNYDHFRENAIPAMAVMVAGGALSAETLNAIEDQFTAIKGRKSFHRLLVIEAVGASYTDTDGQVRPPKLDIQPLRDEQSQDAMFQAYGKSCSTKVRSSFRLPPLFVGATEDYGMATARASSSVAESQVFGPERQKFDEAIDRTILASFRARYWSFRSLPPRISDAEAAIEALVQLDQLGAVTPNVAISRMNETLHLKVAPIAESWGNFPFVMARDLAEQGRLPDLEAITRDE